MNKFVLLVSCSLLWFLICPQALAEELEPASAEKLEQMRDRLEAIYERRDFAEARFEATWSRDSSGYLRLEGGNGGDPELVKYDCESGRRSVLIGGEQLVLPESSRHLKIREFVESPVGGAFLLRVDTTSRDDSGEYWLMNTRTGALQEVKQRIGRLVGSDGFSADGRNILFRRGSNLFIYNFETEQSTQLTHDEREHVNNGPDAKWSPDSSKIAYVQQDSSQVPQRPFLEPADPTYLTVRWEPYSRVGATIATYRIGVVAAQGGETTWVDLPTKEADFYIHTLEWAGNSDELLIELLSRGRDQRWFLIADARTGEVRTVDHETDPAWVDSSWRANIGVDWTQDGQAFAIVSERDGWRHAFVVSRDGKTKKLITNGDYDITDRGPIDEEDGWMMFLASPENATQRYLYRTRLDGSGALERLTPADQPGTHSYRFSPDGQWALRTYSTFDSPPVTDLVHLPDHRVLRVLEDNAPVRERIKPLVVRPTDFFQLDIGDDVVMDAWMIKPREFDPSKKYPVFVFIYGEPHGQTVLDDWSGGQRHTMFHRAIADLGYVVVSMDNRGTPGPKGAAWRRAIFPSLGPLSTEEQAKGIEALGRKYPYMDLSRVGIWGWSGGGSNTLNAMFRKPDVYHVGIAVAPKPQPHLYNAWFQEIYMRTREENPAGYRQSAPINFAEGLKGDLLIVAGTGETNTHIQITEGLVDRLIELGKHFDYMAYPNRDHGLREGKGTAVHLRMLMARYLVDHLPAGGR